MCSFCQGQGTFVALDSAHVASLAVYTARETFASRARKEVVIYMALYTIIRIYEVPANSQQEATDRMMKALWLRVERDFHARDIIREPGSKAGAGEPVSLKPSQGWMQLIGV